MRAHVTPWRRLPHQRRAPRPHPQRAAYLSRSPPRRSYVQQHRHRKALCQQREPRRRRPAQVSSFRSRTATYCRWVSLFRTATVSCILPYIPYYLHPSRRKSRTTGCARCSFQPPYEISKSTLTAEHQQVRVRARQRVGVVRLLVRDVAGAGAYIVRGEKLPLPPAATVPLC